MEPFKFTIRFAEFNLDLLPIDRKLLEGNREMLRKAVERYFADRFGKQGNVQIVSRDESAEVTWVPSSLSGEEAVFDYALKLLKERAYDEAEPYLLALAARSPDNAAVSLNYGMMLTEQGRLDEAVERLTKAVGLMPESADAWNALGLAQKRKGNDAEALKSLERSHALAPDSPHTLRNLGAVLAKTDPARALECLRRAVELMPGDQQSLCGYGQMLLDAGRLAEADAVLRRAVDAAPYTEVGERAMRLRTDISHRSMKAKVGGGLRPDVVSYCLAAMRLFEEAGAARRQAIAFEIALLGRSGLDINDSSKTYTLKSLPGEHTGLELVSCMYVGFRQMNPGADIGIDLSAEYEEAKRLFKP